MVLERFITIAEVFMKYLLLSLMIIFLTGCINSNNESLCENVTCVPWEYCNYKTGNCEVSKGYCSDSYDCEGVFSYCDNNTHKCEEISCNDSNECQNKSYGSYCKNKKCYETLYCSITDDCTIMNYDTTEFACNGGFCIPYQQVNFNESFELNQNNFFSMYYYFVLTSENSMYDFDFTISDFDNLSKFYAATYIYKNSLENYYTDAVYGCEKKDNSLENVVCEVNNLYLQQKVYMTLYINYRSCISDCENIKPVITFSQNNSNGCETNDDCISNSKNLTTYKSICDTQTHICKANTEENISNLGEKCDTDANCIGHTTGNVKCNGTCYQINCSSYENVCKPLFDETAQYCDKNYLNYDYTYCRSYCNASNDGNCLASEQCNISTNQCKQYY